MTKKERKLYHSNPSIRTVIQLNRNKDLEPNMVLVYTEKNQGNIIYFTNEEEKYIITSVKGPVSQLSKISQYQALKNRLVK